MNSSLALKSFCFVSWIAIGITPAIAAGNPLLDKAHEYIDAFEYEKAIAILDLMLEDKSLPQEDCIQGLSLKGRLQVGFGCDAKAIEIYHKLLRLESAFTLPESESPKVKECFDLAKQTLPPPEPPPLEQIPPGMLSTGPPPPPFWKTWWFWTGTSVVVAGMVVGGVLLGIEKSKPEPISGNIKNATLPP